MNTQITLSEAEIKMIEANRLKLEARKAEVEAQDYVDRDSAIARAKEALGARAKEAVAKSEATRSYFHELLAIDSRVDFSAKVQTLSQEVYYYKEIWNEDYTKYESERVSLEPLTVEVPENKITYRGKEIRIEEHVVYHKSRSMFSSRVKSKDWEMKISYDSRFYKSAATVIKKIDEEFEAAENKIKHEQKQKSAVENALAKYKALYPTATITSKEEGERVTTGWNKYEYHIANILTIVFENKIKVSYKIYPDGSMGRKELSFGENVKNADQLIALLNNITIE